MSGQITEAPTEMDRDLAALALKARVEDFLSYEGELLDTRQYDRWLDLLDEDLRYWMPVATNFEHGMAENEFTREQEEAAWFDEGKFTLEQRVQQIQGGDHWAEEPLSRTTHVTTNVRILSATESEITLNCRFLLYVNRREEEVRLFVGKRTDVLKVEGASFLVKRRSIFLDQSKLLAKNLTTFF